MKRNNCNGIADPARRRVLAGLAAAPALVSGLSACSSSSGNDNGNAPASGISPAALPPAGKTLPDPDDSGIEQVVVVMMENRSFDHFLGWLPGANGVQTGLRFPDRNGQSVDSFALASAAGYGYQGCGREDPDHSYDGGRKHLNGGKMDGFLQTVSESIAATDHFPVGYYTRDDLPFFAGCADHWTICDNYFHGILSSTYPNRFYLHAGQTDRVTNTSDISSLETIWDRMDAAGLSSRYYFNDVPFLALWGSKYLARSVAYEQFVLEAAAGLLPQLSVIDPRFLGESPNGVSNDDHPQADVRNGQAFLNSVYDAVRNSPQWSSTLMVIVYDEWGGFFDHVVPPIGPVTAAEARFNDGRLGFRVPCILIGPRAPKQVCNLQFDINSLLNMICWRWKLPPLGARGNWSLNMAWGLNFDTPPRSDNPAFAVGNGPFGMECTTSLPFPIPQFPGSIATLNPAQIKQAQHNLEWLQLADLARVRKFIG